MMLCHSCHIYGIWRNKDLGGCFKVIVWGGNASHKDEGVFMGQGSSHYLILLFEILTV